MEDSLIGEAIGLKVSLPEAQETPSIPERLIQFDEAQRKFDEAQRKLDEAQADSIRLMLGSKHQGHKGRRAEDCYQLTTRHVGFGIKTKLQPASGFGVKAEFAPVGEKHPHAWPTEATLEDPGSRLAIPIGVRDSDDREIAVEYPSSDSWQACYKANRLVDELDGDSLPRSYQKAPEIHIC